MSQIRRHTLDGRLNAAHTGEAVQQFRDACARVGIEHTEVLRSLADAFTEHVERHGEVTFPIKLSVPARGSR